MFRLIAQVSYISIIYYKETPLHVEVMVAAALCPGESQVAACGNNSFVFVT